MVFLGFQRENSGNITFKASVMSLQEEFFKNGYIILKNALTAEQVEYYKDLIDKLSDYSKKPWTMPDGMANNKGFWPVIFNQKVINAVKQALGNDAVKYLQHDDIHRGYSSFAWHRDSVCRTYGVGPEWDERVEPYQLVRTGIYMLPEETNYRFGLIKGSHRPGVRFSEAEFKEIDHKIHHRTNLLSKLTGRDQFEKEATWIQPGPGDCLIFDPRLIHTGSKFMGTKHAMYNGYGVVNSHFRNFFHYYRYLRYDLGYKTIPDELKEKLIEANLFVEEKPHSGKITGAWVPSKAFVAATKVFDV